jgi:hypothetical protein
MQLKRSGDVGRRDSRRRARLRVCAQKAEASLLCLWAARWDSLQPWTDEILCHANAPLVLILCLCRPKLITRINLFLIFVCLIFPTFPWRM